MIKKLSSNKTTILSMSGIPLSGLIVYFYCRVEFISILQNKTAEDAVIFFDYWVWGLYYACNPLAILTDVERLHIITPFKLPLLFVLNYLPVLIIWLGILLKKPAAANSQVETLSVK